MKTFKTVLRWVLGVGAILSFLMYVNNAPVSAFVYLLSGVFIIPITHNQLFNKFKIVLNRVARYGITLGLSFFAMIFLPKSVFEPVTQKADLKITDVKIEEPFKWKVINKKMTPDVDGKEVNIYNILIYDVKRDISIHNIGSEISGVLSKQSACVIHLWDNEEAYHTRTDAFNKFVPENYDNDFKKSFKAKNEWDKENYYKYAEHLLGTKDAFSEDFLPYPLMDWYYKELGGRKVKNDTLKGI